MQASVQNSKKVPNQVFPSLLLGTRLTQFRSKKLIDCQRARTAVGIY
jgi:hypothetical protein